MTNLRQEAETTLCLTGLTLAYRDDRSITIKRGFIPARSKFGKCGGAYDVAGILEDDYVLVLTDAKPLTCYYVFAEWEESTNGDIIITFANKYPLATKRNQMYLGLFSTDENGIIPAWKEHK